MINGAVAVDDNATKSITDITLDGYGTATLGSVGSLDKLVNLSLANSAAGATLHTTKTSLNLTVNDVDHAVNVDGTGPTITSLNLTAAAEASTFALTAAAATALTVDAAVALNVTGSTLSVLETATITGAGDVTLGNVSSVQIQTGNE